MMIASQTGWTRDFIRKQLPIAEGLQYQHAACCLAGVETVSRDDSEQDIAAYLKEIGGNG